MPDFNLTRCELEVMDVVWRNGRVTVQEVVNALDRSLAYTTVMTTLKILDKKRQVVRRFKSSRAFVYEAIATREQVSRKLADQLTRQLYHGSLKSFVLSLIGSGGMSAADIRELQETIQSVENRQ